MIKEIEFRAIIAPNMSGIKTGNDGMRVSIDIPESDVEDAVPLIALRGVPLIIRVRVDTNPLATKKAKAEEKPAKTKREKKPPKPKGEFGRYWQAMYRHGALNHPGLHDALVNLITISRQAEAEAQQ